MQGVSCQKFGRPAGPCSFLSPRRRPNKKFWSPVHFSKDWGVPFGSRVVNIQSKSNYFYSAFKMNAVCGSCCRPCSVNSPIMATIRRSPEWLEWHLCGRHQFKRTINELMMTWPGDEYPAGGSFLGRSRTGQGWLQTCPAQGHGEGCTIKDRDGQDRASFATAAELNNKSPTPLTNPTWKW